MGMVYWGRASVSLRQSREFGQFGCGLCSFLEVSFWRSTAGGPSEDREERSVGG